MIEASDVGVAYKFSSTDTFESVLKPYIRKEIHCVLLFAGEVKILSGKLNEVKQDISITIDGVIIYLNENNVKIKSIVSDSGEVLYTNEKIKDTTISKEEQDIKDICDDLESKKHELIEKGINLVKSELVESWLDFINKGVHSVSSILKINTAIEMMTLIEKNVPFEIIDVMYKGKIDSTIIEIVLYFSKNGDLFYESEKRNWK